MPNDTFHNLSEGKKQKILKAAYRLFNNYDYEDITIRDLTREAGIPIGSFYRYFKDKDDLYIYMLNIGENKLYRELAKNKKDSFWMVFGTAKKEFLESVLTEEEYTLDKTVVNASEELLVKYYFHKFNKDIENELRGNLRQLQQEGRLREDIDEDFILHMYKTSMFNILLYYREKNITSFEEKERIKNSFFNKLFLKGITK